MKSSRCHPFVWVALIVAALILVLVLSRFTNSRAHDKPDESQTLHSPSREQVGSPPKRSKTAAGWREEDIEGLTVTETATKPSPLDRHINISTTTDQQEEGLAEYAVRVATAGLRSDILELFTTIENASPEDQDILARGLQALNVSDIAPDLLSFLARNADNSIVAVQARDALARIIAPEDIDQISQAIPSAPEQELVRAYLIQALAQISNPASVDALSNLCVLSKDPDIYCAVSSALGSIGTPEAVAALVVLIQDGGITELSDPLAQALIAVANKDSRLLLQDQFLNATNPVIEYATAYALSSLRNQASGVHASPAPDQN